MAPSSPGLAGLCGHSTAKIDAVLGGRLPDSCPCPETLTCPCCPLAGTGALTHWGWEVTMVTCTARREGAGAWLWA